MFVLYFILAILLGLASTGFMWVSSQKAESEITRKISGSMVILLLLSSFFLIIAGFDSFHESSYYGF